MANEERELDPRISLGFVLVLPISLVGAVKEALSDLEGVQVVISKMGVPRSLWIKEGKGP
ncbi:MAG: hypothetical protein V3U52_05270 [Thermoplasmata archaeon]